MTTREITERYRVKISVEKNKFVGRLQRRHTFLWIPYWETMETNHYYGWLPSQIHAMKEELLKRYRKKYKTANSSVTINPIKK